MIKEHYLIICLSNQFFDSHFKTNKYLVMQQLVELGHKVLFVNPPTRIKGKKQMAKGKFKVVEYRSENLVIYHPSHTFNIFPLTECASRARNRKILKIINNKKWTNRKKVLWIYHFDYPRIWKLVDRLLPDIIIYDVVDNNAGFPEYARGDSPYKGFLAVLQKIDRLSKKYSEQNGKDGAAWVFYREKQLAQRANIVFTSHPLLYEKFLKYNLNTIYTPNAGSFNLYSVKPPTMPTELVNLKRPIVGYSGAIDSFKFDIDLFVYLAQEAPWINYVLIGAMQLSDSDTRVNTIRDLPNVSFLGTKSYEATASLTNYFDAYIIPYEVNDYTYYGCFPVKLFNAMATGMPIVATDLPAYHGLEDVLYIAKNKYDFLEKLKLALSGDSHEMKQKRIYIAQQNTWVQKTNKQLKAIESEFRSMSSR